MKLLPVPQKLSELEALHPDIRAHVAVKPDWQGFWGHLLGWPVQFFAWLRFGPAVKFMLVYNTWMAGWFMLRVGKRPEDVSEGDVWHESMHAWQGLKFFAHALRVMLDPRGVNLPWLRTKVSWRGHIEAMAYALNVVMGHMTADEAVAKLTKPAYATGLDAESGRSLLLCYVVSIRRNTVGAPTTTD